MDLNIDKVTYIHISDIDDDEYGLISHYVTINNEDIFFDIILNDNGDKIYQIFDDNNQQILKKKYFNMDEEED